MILPERTFSRPQSAVEWASPLKNYSTQVGLISQYEKALKPRPAFGAASYGKETGGFLEETIAFQPFRPLMAAKPVALHRKS
jgi:hypothetical protein